MTIENVIEWEVKHFKYTMKIKDGLSLKNKKNYYEVLGKAFDDAFNQYARRERKKYSDNKSNLMKDVIECLYEYFNNTDDKFEKCFEYCINIAKNILGNNSYGIAQKFINMSFKYLYCFDDAGEYDAKFEKCHMPLDKYTLNWVKTFENDKIKKGLIDIKYAWANMEEDLYFKIQEAISDQLKNKNNYKVDSKDGKENICLPSNKLLAEFIIWNQEKINEIKREQKKLDESYEKLCIDLKI